MAMISESARASSAAEARFRIDAPNARPRQTWVVALDPAAERVMQRIARNPWNGARFFSVAATKPASHSLSDIVIDITLRNAGGTGQPPTEVLTSADAIVMIATAGTGAEAASLIGRACSALGIMATGLVVAGPGDTERTLQSLRPHASMIVVASGAEYLTEMLSALRA